MSDEDDKMLTFIVVSCMIILIGGVTGIVNASVYLMMKGETAMTQTEWLVIILTGIGGAVIGAVASIAGSYFMYLGRTKRILEILEELKGDKFNQLREDSKGILAENRNLESGQSRLSSEHDKLREELYKIYLNQEKEKAGKENAARQIPEESKLLTLVKVIYDKHDRILMQNAELSLRVQELKQENVELMQKLEELQELERYQVREQESFDEQEF